MVSLGLGVGVVPKIVLDHSPQAGRIQTWDVQPALEPYDVGSFHIKKEFKKIHWLTHFGRLLQTKHHREIFSNESSVFWLQRLFFMP